MLRRSLPFAGACLVLVACSSGTTSDSSQAQATMTPPTTVPTTVPTTASTTVATTTAATTATAATAAAMTTTTETTTAATSDVVDTAAPDTPASGSGTTATPGAAPTIGEPYVSSVYADPANWICRPDTSDLCDSDLDVTIVAADGTTATRQFVPATDAAIDCFYVYPTTSEDRSPNSDLVAGAELATTRLQAARFSEVCDLYAPIYRSVTLAALFRQVPSDLGEAFRVAYADVVDAWRHYLANDNRGRGVILIGHSQGSSHLGRLLREEIDGDAGMRDLLVAAYVAGTSIDVPLDADVGGDLEQIPLCRAPDATGCVVTYSTFRSTAPPPPNAFFGRPRTAGGGMAGCVNPASPGGGSAVVRSAFPSGSWALSDRSLAPATPFMDLPGLVTAECRSGDGFSYLELTVHPNPADPRADDIAGADITPEWGTHLVDINVLSGSLIDLARRQVAAYTAR